jgi:hypothetical protein
MKANDRIPVGPPGGVSSDTTHGGPAVADSFVCSEGLRGEGVGAENRVLRWVVAANGQRPALIFRLWWSELGLRRFHLRAGVGGENVVEVNATKPHKSRAWIFHLIGGVFVGGRYFSALSFQTAALAQKRGHLVYSGLWLSLFPQPVAGDEFAHGRRNQQNAPGGRRRPGR